MFARVNIFEGSVESLIAGLTDVQTSVIPAVRALPGNAGIYVLIDRESGRSLAITLWESEEAMRASEADASTIRESSAERQNERIVSIDRYEVAFASLPVATGA